MGTRYGRRARDGTTEYYDSKAELVAAANRETAARMANIFTVIGLIGGGVLAYNLLHRTGASGWPKSIRFTLLGGSAVVFGLVLRVLGRYVLILLAVLLVGSLFLNLGRWLWHLA